MKKNIQFLFLFLCFTALFANSWEPLNRFFTPTPPPSGEVRSIAEFEPMKAVIVRYPLRIPVSLVAEMSTDINVISVIATSSMQTIAENEYNQAGANLSNCTFMVAATNSEWARDWGPWFIFDGNNEFGIIDFPYNRDRPLDDDIPIIFANNYNYNLYGMNVIHTGGNYMSDGLDAAASTDLVYDENNLTEQQIATNFDNYLGVENYHITIDPQADYIKHVDCWAKFLSVDKILISQVSESDGRYQRYEEVAAYFAGQTSSWGTPYKVYRVYTPGTPTNVTPYTNSLILNNKVFVPQTGSEYDDDAITVYENAMPGYQIIGVNYNMWFNTDALHCRTHEVPDDKMLYINHTPLIVNQNFTTSLNFKAYVYPHSGGNIISGYPKLYYKTEYEDWQSVTMQQTSLNNVYSVSLNNLESATDYYYYISAKDDFNKVAKHPFIGRADPHKFIISPFVGEPTIVFENPFEDTVNTNCFPVTMACSVIHPSTIESVKLEYSVNNVNKTPISFEHIDGNDYQLNWEDNFNVNDEVEFKIVAVPSYGSASQTPVYNFTISGVNANNANNANKPIILTNYPNPFNPSTEIKYFLPKSGKVNVSIYNIKGKKVKTIYNGYANKGFNTKGWNGIDFKNKNVSSGIYFVKLIAKEKTVTKKIMLLK